MKNRFKYHLNYSAILLALGSFLFGSLWLLSYKITHADPMLVIGLYYTISAVIINAFMLLFLIVNAIAQYKDYKENILTILILLINIPITNWYMEIVF